MKHGQVGAACCRDGSHGRRAGGWGRGAPAEAWKAGPENAGFGKSQGRVPTEVLPCRGALGWQCHFLPSALEKTNPLNCLHMLLGALREGARGPPCRRKHMQTSLSHCSLITGRVGAPGHQAQDIIFHEEKVPRAGPGLGGPGSLPLPPSVWECGRGCGVYLLLLFARNKGTREREMERKAAWLLGNPQPEE